MKAALGLIETIGLGTAITALDAAAKTADIIFIGHEKVIGAGKSVSVTVQIAGEVAAVQAAVESGVLAAERVGRVISHRVIPRPHEEVDMLLAKFSNNISKEIKKEEDHEKMKEE
ncbi:BMC domain-containing protein [Lutibacter sp. B2]|nr:BMC domain-containing protein [Lutibacter sp. B2]